MRTFFITLEEHLDESVDEVEEVEEEQGREQAEIAKSEKRLSGPEKLEERILYSLLTKYRSDDVQMAVRVEFQKCRLPHMSFDRFSEFFQQ